MSSLTKGEREAIIRDFVDIHGRFIPALFIEEARSTNHPAHGWFTWDNEDAAHQHRMHQARSFIRDIKITFEVETVDRGAIKVRTVDVPALVSPIAERSDGLGYLSVHADDPQSLMHLRVEAASSLASWLKRYGGVVAVAGGSTVPIEQQIAALKAASVVSEPSEVVEAAE